MKIAKVRIIYLPTLEHKMAIESNINKKHIRNWGLLSGLLFVLIGFYFSLPKVLFPHQKMSTVVLSNDGSLLSAAISTDQQWHFPSSIEIPDKYKKAAIHFEDRRFYRHIGFDLKAIFRAIKKNLAAGKIVSGASTITMQTIRIHRNNPRRTFVEKLREILLAVRLELRFSKEEIFDLYARHAPYGGNVIGIDAASWRFFGKSSDKISWAEAALLAVLPNSPGLIHTEKNRDRLQNKRDNLLKELHIAEIIDQYTYESALIEPIPRRTKQLVQSAPHMLQQLKKENGAGIFQSTINMEIQNRCLEIAKLKGNILKENNIDNLAILVLDIEKNETVAYVGNLDNTGPDNQPFVDMIQAPRSTGSLLKPFLYAASLDEGLILEKSLLPDYPIQMNGFVSENYSRRHDGLVSADRALQRSLNIPFAYLLQQYGIEKFRLLCQDLGLKTINKGADYYGIPLILGGAESTLWEHTNAYGFLGKTLNTYEKNDGYYQVEDLEPAKLLASRKAQATKRESKKQSNSIVFRAESIWKTLENIRKVERPTSQGSWRKFSSTRTIGWKTGTSNGFKDAWAIGVNGKYAIGVWVGNADGEGRPGIVGSQAAAPIFFSVVNSLVDHSWFQEPVDELNTMAVCKLSGNMANNYCPVDSQKVSRAARDLDLCTYHQGIFTDQSGTYQVSAQCYDMSQARSKSQFILPTKIAYYYKKNAYYESPLPSYPACIESNKKLEPSLIYPEFGMRIYLPRIDHDRRNKLILKAFHGDPNAKIYWHIDDTFEKTTENIHEIDISLEKGIHTITLIDDRGAEVVNTFEIIE